MYRFTSCRRQPNAFSRVQSHERQSQHFPNSNDTFTLKCTSNETTYHRTSLMILHFYGQVSPSVVVRTSLCALRGLIPQLLPSHSAVVAVSSVATPKQLSPSLMLTSYFRFIVSFLFLPRLTPTHCNDGSNSPIHLQVLCCAPSSLPFMSNLPSVVAALHTILVGTSRAALIHVLLHRLQRETDPSRRQVVLLELAKPSEVFVPVWKIVSDRNVPGKFVLPARSQLFE